MSKKRLLEEMYLNYRVLEFNNGVAVVLPFLIQQTVRLVEKVEKKIRGKMPSFREIVNGPFLYYIKTV